MKEKGWVLISIFKSLQEAGIRQEEPFFQLKHSFSL